MAREPCEGGVGREPLGVAWWLALAIFWGLAANLWGFKNFSGFGISKTFSCGIEALNKNSLEFEKNMIMVQPFSVGSVKSLHIFEDKGNGSKGTVW